MSGVCQNPGAASVLGWGRRTAEPPNRRTAESECECECECECESVNC